METITQELHDADPAMLPRIAGKLAGFALRRASGEELSPDEVSQEARLTISQLLAESRIRGKSSRHRHVA